MSYDSDKTSLILDQLRDAIRSGHVRIAMQFLRHADAGGRLRRDPGVLAALKNAVGERQAAALVNAFAVDACPVCAGGREKCEDCDGKGSYDQVRVCGACAGLGLRRCPFCNGTSFAGYDFVPRGLRPAVLRLRLRFAKQQIAALSGSRGDKPVGAREIAKRILALDRCRGVLANAVEQLRPGLGAPDGRQIFSAADRMRIERECRQHNGRAEASIRRLLSSLGERFSQKARRPGQDTQKRRLLAHQAEVFTKLSRGENFGESALRTPMGLRRR